ncbi:MAG: hypothetical protein LBC98_10360, partial [Prevotellaceae bacterium]|nr:hypothetical protein [Prevotellaceae bacterium]
MRRFCRFALTVIMILISVKFYGQGLQVTIDVTHGTCAANGELLVKVSGGDEASLRYSLVSPSPITTLPRTENKFSGLP